MKNLELETEVELSHQVYGNTFGDIQIYLDIYKLYNSARKHRTEIIISWKDQFYKKQ